MKSQLRKNIFIIFWVVALLDITGIILGNAMMHLIFKPLLMPVLMIAVLSSTTSQAGKTKIIAAVFFSFAGDVFLLFQDKRAVFFILGLSCFLITHIFYISYFIQLKKPGDSLIKKAPWLAILVIIYSSSLLYILFPHLGALKVPVILYACIISLMLFFSFYLSFDISKPVRQLVIAGASCFVLSDTLLAMDKFYEPFPFAAVFIMSSYCLAQFLIVKGFITKGN